MKIKNYIPDGLKSFCQTIWIFSGVLVALMILLNICYWSVHGPLARLYDFLGLLSGLLLPAGCVLSAVWLVIMLVWCIVIAKKENDKSIFLKPAVVITNFLNIVNFIWILAFIAF